MNHIHHQLARDRQDEFLREAADQRMVSQGVISARFAHLRLRVGRPLPTSRLKRRRAAPQATPRRTTG
jgi:hypothetical protein